jgi:hypothetical protein
MKTPVLNDIKIVADSQNLPKLPSPRLIGNLLQIDPSRIHLNLENWAERYGSFTA